MNGGRHHDDAPPSDVNLREETHSIWTLASEEVMNTLSRERCGSSWRNANTVSLELFVALRAIHINRKHTLTKNQRDVGIRVVGPPVLDVSRRGSLGLIPPPLNEWHLALRLAGDRSEALGEIVQGGLLQIGHGSLHA